MPDESRTVRVAFDRIGRTHDLVLSYQTSTAPGSDEFFDELLDRVADFARPHLLTPGPSYIVSEEGDGAISCGGRSGGHFAWAVTDAG